MTVASVKAVERRRKSSQGGRRTRNASNINTRGAARYFNTLCAGGRLMREWFAAWLNSRRMVIRWLISPHGASRLASSLQYRPQSFLPRTSDGGTYCEQYSHALLTVADWLPKNS